MLNSLMFQLPLPIFKTFVDGYLAQGIFWTLKMEKVKHKNSSN